MVVPSTCANLTLNFFKVVGMHVCFHVVCIHVCVHVRLCAGTEKQGCVCVCVSLWVRKGLCGCACKLACMECVSVCV